MSPLQDRQVIHDRLTLCRMALAPLVEPQCALTQLQKDYLEQASELIEAVRQGLGVEGRRA